MPLRDLLSSTRICYAPDGETGGASPPPPPASPPPPPPVEGEKAPPASQQEATSLLAQAAEGEGEKKDPPGEGEAKPDGEKKPEGEGEKKEGEKPPPDYSALTLPEGIDPKGPMFDAFKAAAADSALAPEAAQKVLDKVAPEVAKALEAPYELWADTQAKWSKEAKADAEIGGDDATFAKNLGIAKTGLTHFAGKEAPKLLEALAFTGAGNNPEVLRFLHRVGKAVSEGTFVPGSSSVKDTRTLAEKLYPSMAENKE